VPCSGINGAFPIAPAPQDCTWVGDPGPSWVPRATWLGSRGSCTPSSAFFYPCSILWKECSIIPRSIRERRFTTCGSNKPTTFSSGSSGLVEVLIQGVALGADQDPRAFLDYNQDPTFPTDPDDCALPPTEAEHGLNPVYLVAGTPVAWLEPQVEQTDYVIALRTRMRRSLLCITAIYSSGLQTRQVNVG
jgi:hypothetical protein